jgi:hypothetical protein
VEEGEYNKKLEAVEKFKAENIDTLQAWQHQIAEARNALFKACCLKPYLQECEPFYCGFRITGICKYPEKFSELEQKLEIT